jgi:hypothetical protein
MRRRERSPLPWLDAGAAIVQERPLAMNTPLSRALLPVLALASAAALRAADDSSGSSSSSSASSSTATSADATTRAPVGHPLRGVIVAVLPEKSALLVKHEEIPDVMSAMTMLLKVDAATLAAAKKDQAITATLLKKPDGWWLENVRPAPTE